MVLFILLTSQKTDSCGWEQVKAYVVLTVLSITLFIILIQLAGRNPTVSLKDKNGTLWFGCNDGSVFYTSGNELQKLLFTNSMSISGMTEGPDGLIYIIPQGKSIFSVNPVVPEEIKQYNLSSDKVLHSAAFAVSGNLLIGTQENILVCSLGKDTILVRDVIEGFENSAINAIHKTRGQHKISYRNRGQWLVPVKIPG